MTETIEPLILDLLEWLGERGRSHAETLDVWRTSCPRLPVWEEATDRGLVERRGSGADEIVSPTTEGLALLRARRGVRTRGIR